MYASVDITACDVQLIYPIINVLIANLHVAVDESAFEAKRKALLTIHDKVQKLRKTIDSQKKAIHTIEQTIETIVKLAQV